MVLCNSLMEGTAILSTTLAVDIVAIDINDDKINEVYIND
jgi:hypothetical protein